MSTKNLARTVIEGGRARYNKFERRHSTAVERSHAHQLEKALLRDVDADTCFVPRQPVYQGFSDKLSPAFRWLRSRAGRPWDKVRSELLARFDTRTTAGRHIVFDHLLAELSQAPSPRFARQRRFALSAGGLLLYRGRERYARRDCRAPLPEAESTLRTWLASRRVRVHGERCYWLLLTAHGGYRQAAQLSAPEVERFRALPRWFQQEYEGVPPLPVVRK